MPLNESYADKRANEILDVIMAYARLEFDQQTKISDHEDVFDAIGTGVNMLGEELRESTVSLREKEHLLKEIHHRVKNNLQIISSLLNLQAGQTTDEKFLALIRDCRNRIHSMSLIHEMLYSTKDLSRINMNKYITTLSKSIYESFASDNSKVEFNVSIDQNIFFTIDKLIPIGLIINEIISNSLKYAFPKQDGMISIDFKKNDAHFHLSVKDNGIGINNYQNDNPRKTLGIQLIQILAEQLECEAKTDHHNGTGYSFTFK